MSQKLAGEWPWTPPTWDEGQGKGSARVRVRVRLRLRLRLRLRAKARMRARCVGGRHGRKRGQGTVIA